MSYYPTLEEDVRCAREILARGRVDDDTGVSPATRAFRPEPGEAEFTRCGWTVVYAAYKLLESFVEAIEAVDPKVCELAMRHRRRADAPQEG